MEVKTIRENEDGSADCTVEMTQEEMESFARVGIVAALEKAANVAANDIKQERVVFPDKLRHIAEQAGFLLWDNEEWKPEGVIVDWAYEYNDDALVKFAELIVRECISRCDDLNSQQYIMQHFGMKEPDWT